MDNPSAFGVHEHAIKSPPRSDDGGPKSPPSQMAGWPVHAINACIHYDITARIATGFPPHSPNNSIMNADNRVR